MADGEACRSYIAVSISPHAHGPPGGQSLPFWVSSAAPTKNAEGRKRFGPERTRHALKERASQCRATFSLSNSKSNTCPGVVFRSRIQNRCKAAPPQIRQRRPKDRQKNRETICACKSSPIQKLVTATRPGKAAGDDGLSNLSRRSISKPELVPA